LRPIRDGSMVKCENDVIGERYRGSIIVMRIL
jgi:hypothetical protein